MLFTTVFAKPCHASPNDIVSTLSGYKIKAVNSALLFRDDEAPGLVKPITIFSYLDAAFSPQIGDLVTVIPIKASQPSERLPIKTLESYAHCGEGPASLFHITLSATHVSTYQSAKAPPGISASYPFDVIIIYPANSKIKRIDKNQLRPISFPKEIRKENIFIALDLDDDGNVDYVQTEYCCEAPDSRTKECDATCQQKWGWVEGGWKLLETVKPC